MNITETKTKVLKVADLRPNEGQITGVPSNPRYITDYEFQALCKSLEEDNLTGVLQMKVYNWQGEWVVLDGNMRLRALQEMGIEEVQCLIVPEDADSKTLRKIVITSNSTFGQYDMDALANDWSDDPLSDWGCDVPEVKETDEENEENQKKELGVNVSYELVFNNDAEQEEWYKFLKDIKDHYDCDTISERILCAIRDWYMLQNG